MTTATATATATELRVERGLSPTLGPVCSYNEWDPLEEVIVGVIDGATVPSWDVSLEATMPSQHRDFFRRHGGRHFPEEHVAAARDNLEELVDILERAGVTVRRPDRVDFARPFVTPDFASTGGLYAAMPRDLLLVVGDQLIETPMAWRSRYFEVHAYRGLLKQYFQQGARWVAAPRPQLADALYDHDYVEPPEDGPYRFVTTEFEPTFDAADFLRCGRDLFYYRSHVTNEFGVEWLRRHLGDEYRLHELHARDAHRMHIDTTYLPLAPGKLLVNPERVDRVHPLLRNWELLPAPKPATPSDHALFMSGPWLSMNVLSIDEQRVVVARHEHALIAALESWGFTPIPCEFRGFYRFGGSIHCATLDVRRAGTLRSYF